jgi:hypothetical protein
VPKSKTDPTHTVWLILCLTGLLISRLLLLLKAPLSAFGYDYGFYLDALKNSQTINWQNLLTAFWGGFNNPIFYVFNLLHFPPQLALTLSYLCFSLLTGLALYWFFYPHNKTAGLFALLLFTLSLVQMESYAMFLYKHALALPFFIFGFKFAREKRWGWFTASTCLILLTHRTTSIIYFFTLGLYWIYKLIISKRYKLLGILFTFFCLLLTTCYLLLDLRLIILNLVQHNNYNVRTGLLFGQENILKYVWPLLPLALAGLVVSFKQKTNVLWLILSGLCLVWLTFHLPFYRRVWLYFDLSLIIFSAYFLSHLNWQKPSAKIAFGIILSFLAFRLGNFSLQKLPFIYRNEIQELQNFHSPTGFILAVSANDAPWLLAFTHGYRLGAPGLLEDPHTYPDWQNFWQGQNQRHFIASYPRPLYIYQRDWQLPKFNLSNCLKPLSPNFSEVDFTCVEATLQN